MRDRHTGSAFARIGCFGLLLVAPFPGCCSGGVSAVAANGDRNGLAAAGADGPGLRVVGENGTRISQPVDEVRGPGGGGDLHGAVAAGLAAEGGPRRISRESEGSVLPAGRGAGL